MLKKSWVLLLLLAAALLIPCSEALASHPIDGTWKFTSGSIEFYFSDGGVTGLWKGALDLDSVDPSEFPVRMWHYDGEYWLEVGRLTADFGIEVNFKVTEASGMYLGVEEQSYTVDQYGELVKSPNVEEYNSDIRHDDGYDFGTSREKTFVKLSSDNSTLTIRSEWERDYPGLSLERIIDEYTLERVSGGGPGIPTTKPTLPAGTNPNVEAVISEIVADMLVFAEGAGGAITAYDLDWKGGYVVVSEDLAIRAAKGVLNDAGAEVKVVPLPVISASVGTAGNTAAVGFLVTGELLMASSPSEIKVLKVLSSEGIGDEFTYAGEPGEFEDKKFTLMSEAGTEIFKGAIQPNVTYQLVVFIEDDGDFDLNKNPRVIVDPLALYGTGSTNGGGGGCSAGLGALALALILPAARITRRKK